eukprot:XP_003725893.2 PREDICTED: zinc finger protein 616-like [Strongylocentrotus purpuratus]
MESDTPMAVHPFQCQFCEAVFSSSIQMAQHWQDQHQEDRVEQEAPIYQLLQTSPFALTRSMSNNVSDVVKDSDGITATNQHISFEECTMRHGAYEEKLDSEISHQGHIQTLAPESSKEIPKSVKPSESNAVDSKGKKDFCCEICGRTYTTTSNLNKHCRTHTGVLYFCSHCKKGFRYKESLKKHEKIHLPEKSKKSDHGCRYRCQYCHKTFPGKLRLSIHFRSHPLEKTYKCDQCQRTFLYKSGLKRHMLSHAAVKAHTCPQCQQSFLTVHSLKAHIKTHSGKKLFFCGKCEKAFAQKLTLIEHMRLHEDTRAYKCSYCGKGFRQRSTLWGHEKIHKREKVHRCSKCEEHFGTLKELRRHEKKHWVATQQQRVDFAGNPVKESPETRRFECDRCGEAFTQKIVLQTHYRRHTGEKPFECEVCGKKFRHLASNKRHALIHKGTKKYHCDICGRSFTKKSYLKWHIAKPHSNLDHENREKGCSNKESSRATGCLTTVKQNEKIWNEDSDSVLSLESFGGSEIEFDNPMVTSSTGAKDSRSEGEVNSTDDTSKLEDFTMKQGLDSNREQSKLVESLTTPQDPSPQTIEGTGVIVSFQDVCDVPINEECVHTTMNVLDHVMQLAQISQRDVQESLIQIEDIPLGQATPEVDNRNLVKDANEKSPKQSLGIQNSPAVKPFVCELCGRMYSSNSSLLRHKQSHLISKPHNCHFCDKSYSRGPLLREHIQFAHSGEHRAHQCTFCEKSFPNATRLDLHVRIHTQDKPFKCAVCQKGFTDSSNLRRHERSHKGLRTHKCLQCGRLFSEKPALQRHLARHQGEKNYQCQHCTKSFALKADLQSHSILHRAAKESRCSQCGLTFKRQISFSLHQACTKKSARKCRVCSVGLVNECRRRQHELDEHKFLIIDSGFACGHCGKSFSGLGKTVNHIREH